MFKRIILINLVLILNSCYKKKSIQLDDSLIEIGRVFKSQSLNISICQNEESIVFAAMNDTLVVDTVLVMVSKFDFPITYFICEKINDSNEYVFSIVENVKCLDNPKPIVSYLYDDHSKKFRSINIANIVCFSEMPCDENIDFDVNHIIMDLDNWQGSYGFGYGFRGDDVDYEMNFEIGKEGSAFIISNDGTKEKAEIVRATKDSLELRGKENHQYILYRENGGSNYAIRGEAVYMLNPPNNDYPLTKSTLEKP